MPDFVLTDENYYSREADIFYMSCSQFQRFQSCEAAAIAEMRGIWEPEKKSEALFQGQYFHSYFEGQEAFDRFCQEHFDEIFKVKETKKRGLEVVGKYAPFEKLDQMIQTILEDPVMSRISSAPGVPELAMTGEIGGIQWRMKMDKYCEDRRILDYKTSANLAETFYSPIKRERQSFIEEYGYMMRAAVYGEIERQNAGEDTFPPFFILAVSKQDPPDKGVYCLNDDARWEFELELLKEKIPRIQRLKMGEVNPIRCGHCEYCRRTKKINRVMMYTELIPEFAYDPNNMEVDDYEGSSVFDTL